MKTKNDSEFNESEFETILNAFYFNYFSNSSRYDFHIPTRTKERKLGYDFGNKKGIPFYLQYKVSSFYQPFSNHKLTNDRKKLKILDKNGFFSFQLHRDKKTGTFIQHNLLHKLGRNNYYVAPLFWKRTQLMDFIKKTLEYTNFTNSINYMLNIRNPTKKNFNSSTPINNQCSYIKPHKKIKSKTLHHYAFNEDFNYSFHSEPELIEGSTTFGEIINNIEENLNDMVILLPELEKEVTNILVAFFEENEIKINLDYINDILEIKENTFRENESLENIFGTARSLSANASLNLAKIIMKDFFDIQFLILEV